MYIHANNICQYMSMYMYVYIHKYMCVCMHICNLYKYYIYMSAYIHIYMHKYINSYMDHACTDSYVYYIHTQTFI